MEKNDDLYTFSDETATNPESQKGWKILLVDPENNFYEKIKNFLAPRLYHDKAFIVLHAHSAQEAQPLLQEQNDINLILARVPAQALDFVRAIRTTQATLPIIFYGDAADFMAPSEDILQYNIHSYLPIAENPDNKLYIAILSALQFSNFAQEFADKKQELEAMQTAAKRFVPHSFLNLLNKNKIADIALTDHVQKEMSVLFLDIRSFTSLSEFLTPVETFEFINHFLSYLEPSVDKHQGFIDKYIGDSVMAIFPERPEDAVNAGMEMLKALERYNVARLSKYQIPIKIGIGINTGMLVMGVIGFYDRMECTVISDAVNTASRIESLTKKIGAPLLISENTYKAMQDLSAIHCRLLGGMGVPGKHEFVEVYEVFNNDPAEVLEKKCQTKTDFEAAVQLFKKLNFQAANALFNKVAELNPYDRPAKFFAEKTRLITDKKDTLL